MIRGSVTVRKDEKITQVHTALVTFVVYTVQCIHLGTNFLNCGESVLFGAPSLSFGYKSQQFNLDLCLL